jgi:hypothetical protein
VHGRVRVIRALRERLAVRADAAIESAQVNGGPGLALRRSGGEVLGVLAVHVTDDGRTGRTIDRLWLTTAPGKLTHWNR